MLRPGTQDTLISRKVNMPTTKSHAELVSDVAPKIKAQSFFSARVAEAHILEKLREVSDGYSRGEFGLGEARNKLKDFLRGEGYDPHQAGIMNLASTARLNLIVTQNAAMANAAAEWKRMHDPDAMKVFPYVRYHASVGSEKPRPEHQKYDGMIFEKTDPWLKTHTPPWDFKCNCQLEEITAKEAGKSPDLIQEPTPADKVTVDSRSGFSFDPEHAFEVQNIGNLQPMSRNAIVQQAADAVRDGKLGNVGLIVAPPIDGTVRTSPMPNIPQVKQGFEAMKEKAREKLVSVGLDPDHLPDYKAVNNAFKAAGKQGKNIESDVLDLFPKKPITVTTLNQRATEAADLPKNLPVILEKGNNYFGIQHLWRDHKEIFVDPEKAIRLLRETLGNINCRVVVSLKRIIDTSYIAGKNIKKPLCLKKIVLHNPQRKTYCVLILDETKGALKLVSWNNAGDDYGNEEWTLT